MIWLASFPRSGNTFVRNILYEVYGIESSTFHYERDYPLDKNFEGYEFVKTHELPHMVIPSDLSIPAVYIVRDGRDALVSMAHHRKDIIAPGSDFYQNLKEAIIADRGSFFGGWSQNVNQWLPRADLIIRYEDLTADPMAEGERIRQIYELPEPKGEKLPTFEQLKHGIPKYGAGKDQSINTDKKKEKARKFFRRGKAGGWKDDMPDELHDLFWSYHGDTMEKLGYSFSGDILEIHPELDSSIRKKLGLAQTKETGRNYKILIESNKIVSPDNDGVKRYQVELLKGLIPLVENPDSRWNIDLFIHGRIYPLQNYKKKIEGDFNKSLIDQSNQNRKKSIFERFEQLLIKIIPSKFIQYIFDHDIRIFHTFYRFLKRVVFFMNR